MKLAALIQYKGTDYSGFQRQNNAPSIQEVIEDALHIITQEDCGTTKGIIKKAIIDDNPYSKNWIHSRGPSSLLNQSNQLTPIKNFPYGKIYTKQ